MKCLCLALLLAATAMGQDTSKRVAGITTEYRHNSHADVILSRLLETHTLDGRGAVSPLKLVSLFTDQVPATDTSRRLAAEHRFTIYDNVSQALTLGTGKLAVDGVLLVAEHGKYPSSPTGQVVYPKRRLFEEVVRVFEASGVSVPVFIDKHLADNWEDAHWIYQSARRLKVPLMAGSSLPTLWRYPPVDVERGAKLEEIVAVSYHTLDAYGFHGLEMIQCLAERRHGGETGVRRVQCLTGDAVWEAGEQKLYDAQLLTEAMARLKRPPPATRSLKELVKQPVLFRIEYADGLRANMLTLNGAVGEWSVAWRYAEAAGAATPQRMQSTLFYTQEARPFMHFSYLVNGIEQMMLTGKPAWPVERTLLTSGLLDALLISKQQGGVWLDTPHLNFAYASEFNWQRPPEPPPDRPINGQ